MLDARLADGSRVNVIIHPAILSGPSKTTLLNALSGRIDEKERVVTIEDTAELQMQQPHVLRLETRPPDFEGKGGITQRDLMRNALRMRPDRIILGEVRGPEAFDLLQAMNTDITARCRLFMPTPPATRWCGSRTWC